MSSLFGWTGLPFAWLYTLYFNEKYGYGRQLAVNVDSLDLFLNFIFIGVMLFFIFIFIPAFLRSKHEETFRKYEWGYYALSIMTIGLVSCVCYAIAFLRSSRA